MDRNKATKKVIVTVEVPVVKRVIDQYNDILLYLELYIDGSNEKDQVVLYYNPDNNVFHVFTEAGNRAWRKPAVAFRLK